MSTTAGLHTAVLAAISHGTSSPAGRAAVQGLFDRTVAIAAGAATLTDIGLGHVDVEQPDTAATLSSLSGDGPAVIVPLLLSAGFHVNVDLQEAAEACARTVIVAGALGPDERLIDALEQRLYESGADPASDVIILGAAGSSDVGAVRDVKTAAGMLADRLGCPVQEAYLSFAQPTVEHAVSAAQDAHPGRRIVLASYLLAPGLSAPALPAGSRPGDRAAAERHRRCCRYPTGTAGDCPGAIPAGARETLTGRWGPAQVGYSHDD